MQTIPFLPPPGPRAFGLALVALLVPALAQALPRIEPQASHQNTRSGAELYQEACANCHGADGRGSPQLAEALGTPMPDFTECSFATREPDVDWLAVAHDGGPARAFSPNMPAFGPGMSVEALERVLAHMRSFCADGNWPRGELNLPRPLVTEKAYPEDEAVIDMAINTEGPGALSSTLVYEQRFGARNQFEVIVPVALSERPSGSSSPWVGGVGDIAVGAKRAVYHNLRRGSVFSVAGEVVLPTGSDSRGVGKGTALFEPFVAFGQLLPADAFLHFQGGVELPFDTDKAANEAFWRVAVGKSFSQGRWGRTWSPMLELVAARELESGAVTDWDAVPQVQVTLSTRQHIMANVGVRLPLNDAGERPTRMMFYLLWDWFDGPLFGGW